MNIEGKLVINLSVQPNHGLNCTIDSTRPLHISQLFIGKPIQHLLKTVPLLFNICSMAQATAAVRATEQALGETADTQTEQQRDTLVILESLREQSWQLLISSAATLQEATDQQTLAALTHAVQALSQQLHHPTAGKNLFALQAVTSKPNQEDISQRWQALKTLLEDKILAASYTHWLETEADIIDLTKPHTSQPLRFLAWLKQQSWADSGQTQIAVLPPDTPEIDTELLQRFKTESVQFTRTPDWQGQAREVSNFSLLQEQPLIQQLIRKHGNGLYTRSVARLLSIALLSARLDKFFTYPATTLQSETHTPQKNKLKIRPNHTGLAHVNAARGRLTHYIVLAHDQNTVEHYNILAPTEWNFHPTGLAAQGLENLDMNYPHALEQQAGLLIDAIDPCVGYDLIISAGSGVND